MQEKWKEGNTECCLTHSSLFTYFALFTVLSMSQLDTPSTIAQVFHFTFCNCLTLGSTKYRVNQKWCKYIINELIRQMREKGTTKK